MSPDLNLIMVPTTKCNLSCDHCFENRSDREMTTAELQVVMRKVYDYSISKDIKKIIFYWQGGEVFTLGPSWFERMDEITTNVFTGSNIRIRHRLQSNLISYSGKWKPIIKTIFQNSIGSSLDYPSLYRGFKSIKTDRFNDIWSKFCKCARSDGIDVSVISVLNHASLKIPPAKFLQFYGAHMGITNMQLNFPFTLNAIFPNKLSIFLDPSELGKFLVDLFDAWIDESSAWYKKLHVNPFCELIDVFSYSPKPSRCNCIWSGNCAETFFSIGPDSSVGLCDCWVTSLKAFTFGNLKTQTLNEISDNPIRDRFGKRIESIMESECADCPYLGICFGGCIIRAYGKHGTIERRDPYCEAYKALFSKVHSYVRSINISGGDDGVTSNAAQEKRNQ